MLDLLDRATQLACTAHDKTYRKSKDKLPYIAHPTMVAMYLMKEGLDEEIIAAAILHDTVEDTDVTIEDIKEKFGERVADLVAGCTEDKTKTWKERKQGQLDKIKTIPYDILMIKLSDKLHNISSTVQDLHEKGRENMFNQKSGFNSNYEGQKWYYKGLVESFSVRDEVNNTEMFKLFKSRVDEVFN